MKENKKRGDKVRSHPQESEGWRGAGSNSICKAWLSSVPLRGTEEAEGREHQGANMAVKWSSLGSGKGTKPVVAPRRVKSHVRLGPK